MPKVGFTPATRRSKVESSITKISVEKQFGKALITGNGSKQVTLDKTLRTISPVIDFDTLLILAENSYIIGGIVDKVATTCDSGIEMSSEETSDDGTQKDPLLEVAENVDFEFLFYNLYALSNSFFEVIRDVKTGKVVELVPVIASEVKRLQGGEGYLQQVGSQKAYFNSFMKDDTPQAKKKKQEAIKRFEKSKAPAEELIGSPDGAGYNPTLNEIYQFKGLSLRNRYYGDTPLKKVIAQAVLLANIDKYYNMLFEKSNIKNKIYYSKEGKLTEKQRRELQEAIRETLAGAGNAFKSLVMNGELGALALGETVDDKAFLEKVQQLEQAICIGLKMPYDMLKSTDSNRASASVAIKTMYKQLIEPLQKRALLGIKDIFYNYNNVQTLQFAKVDTQDFVDMVDAIKKLVDTDIITRYEARQDLGYKQREKATLDQFADTEYPAGDTPENADALANTEEDVAKLYNKKDIKKEEDRKK